MELVSGLLIFAILLIAGMILALLVFWTQTNAKISALSARLRDAQEGTTHYFGEIQQSIGKVLEVGERMKDVGKGISDLEGLLRPPQPRGAIGELMLGELLAQILPPSHYTLQHAFKSGERVDAAILLGPGMVPVDAKFPLSSFQRVLESETDEDKRKAKREFIRTVKGQIDTIATKYILPDEGTFDFALMYIPAESVYYETIIKEEALADEKGIFPYALERKVIPVSPNSFYAYLQVIVRGLKGMQIEEHAQEIMAHLGRLQGDFARFHQDFKTLGTHIQHAHSKYYEEAAPKLEALGDKLAAIGQAERAELPPPKVDQPEEEEEP